MAKTELGLILATGCSSGIGRAAALYLDDLGYRVFAGVRRIEDASALRDAASPRLEPVMLDVTKPDDLAAIGERVGSEGGLFALVNNAGFNYIAPFEATDARKARALMETNLFGLAALTQVLLPHLRATARPQRWSRIINISSIGGLIGVPWEPWYHASKFALIGLSESLSHELAAQHVAVSVICPGGIRTPFIAKSGAEVARTQAALSSEQATLYGAGLDRFGVLAGFAGRHGSPPEAVAVAIAGMLRGRRPPAIQLVGRDAKAMHAVKRWAPRLVFDAWMRAVFTAAPRDTAAA